MNNDELAVQIKESEDLKTVIDDFNNAIIKGDMLRKLVTDDLIDSTLDKMSERLNKYGDEFSHKDLTDYLKALVGVQNKQNQDSTPTNIRNSINLTQVNVNTDNKESFAFNRASRAKITDALNMLMQMDKDNIENLSTVESDDEHNE